MISAFTDVEILDGVLLHSGDTIGVIFIIGAEIGPWLSGSYSGMILGLRPANERRRYKVTPSLISQAQTWISPDAETFESNMHPELTTHVHGGPKTIFLWNLIKFNLKDGSRHM